MTTRFGYACINTELQSLKPRVTCNRGMIQRTFKAKGLKYASELSLQNSSDLIKHVEWNHADGIKVFRVTSCMFPWHSEYNLTQLPDYEAIKDNLAAAGALALKHGIRLSTHPGQFNVLTSQTERVVLIDTEGGVCLLHPERFKTIDPIRHPFPGLITNAVLLGNDLLISTWVERELSLARLAALDLKEPLQDGIELPDLRIAIEDGKINHHHVAGSVWSHILDAEPLGLCTFENDLIFCTHHRGLYRVTSTSDEVWRRKPLEWDSLVQLSLIHI